MHFSMNNDWIKSAIVTGSASGNQASYWSSGTTKFPDHTANLPDNAYSNYNQSPYCISGSAESESCPLFLLYKPMNGIINSYAVMVDDNLRIMYAPDSQNASFLCDDNEWTMGDGRASVDRATLHQIWFKRKQ